MIALGALPGTFLVIMFWFLPVALFGLLRGAVVIAALADAAKHPIRRPPAEVG